ncbi:MAG: ABC transporter ATP-binding protein [Treponemataceae bacterium]|nr:ABC transporter ATP-binding protein [Treponemataceae bacterium]
MTVLQTADLSAGYGNTPILHHLSVSFRPGTVTCLMGANGSGKSTLLHVLCGLEVLGLQVTAGQVTCNGKDVGKLKSTEKAKLLSFLPQNERYTWNFSVMEAVLMGRYAASSGTLGYTKDDYGAAEQALEKAGITSLKDRRIFELSGGELQSVLIARCLTQNTPYLLLDEPFSHLDASRAAFFMKQLQQLAHDTGIGVVISIHDVNLAPLYADQLAVLKDGRLVACGSVPEVFTPEVLSTAYGTAYGVFDHPYYHVPQAYLL